MLMREMIYHHDEHGMLVMAYEGGEFLDGYRWLVAYSRDDPAMSYTLDFVRGIEWDQRKS